MISRYAVWLNDASLADISPKIYVSNISYQAVSPTRSSSRISAYDGKYTNDKDYIAENKITISFVVREYDTRNRQQIVQDVIAWASNGGVMKTSDRTGQYIRVMPTRFPAVLSVLNWLDELSIEFTSSDYPFWQDVNPYTVMLNNGSNGVLRLAGTRDAFVEAEITILSNTTKIRLECGDTFIELTGLSLNAGAWVKVHYTEDHHIFSIDYDNTESFGSLLDKRTASSNDDLVAHVGENTVKLMVTGNAICTFSVRGVYM